MGQYRLEGDQGSPVEGVRPCSEGGVLQVVSKPVPSRKCADEDIGPLRGVDCDDLSGRVRGTGSYLVLNSTSPGWLRKGLKGKRVPFIITEAFSERLAKEFARTPKLSVL